MGRVRGCRLRVGAAVLAVAAVLVSASAGAGAEGPQLANPHPCPSATGFTCSTLRVPLDHSGRLRGTLDLNVAVADTGDAPRGVLVFLTGGPGQPGVPLAPPIRLRLGSALAGYRLVMIDQRGTGGTAIDCPLLQGQVGTSDIAPPTPAAVRDCADRLGPRRAVYSTWETVADLDLLRRALHVGAWTLDGVSYGTFVAERYAIAHPGAVRALVLDSVLPHVDPQTDDALYLVGLRATARVLRASCAELRCGFDPAGDVDWLVRHGVDGVTLFDTIVTYEFFDPTYEALLSAIHSARQGDRRALDALELQTHQASRSLPARFSSGLHAATLCADLPLPWGAATTTAARRTLLARRVSRLKRSDVWPFVPATAAGNGIVATCLNWPPISVPAGPPAGSMLPDVPTLLLNGDRDLSTPLEWAREEARLAPGGTLVVVRGASHSVQSREQGTAGRSAVRAFLQG